MFMWTHCDCKQCKYAVKGGRGNGSVGERGRTCSYNSYPGLKSHSFYDNYTAKHNYNILITGEKRKEKGENRKGKEERGGKVHVREERREGEFRAFRSTMTDYM